MAEALPPALSIPLAGRALIEASAGTGKTWTLTAMVLRLLLEGERPPRQIIATTFTRKAAAEMKRRIHQALLRLQSQHKALSALEEAQRWTALEALSEPLDAHILRHHLRNQSWERLGARLQLSLQEYGQMFINTLDALCQRWLSEYALETGSGQKRQLLRNGQLAEALSHDALRFHYQEIWPREALRLGQYLRSRPPSLQQIQNLSQQALEFSRSQLDDLPPADAEEDAEALWADAAALDWTAWAAWTEALLSAFPANGKLAQYWSAWPDLRTAMQRREEPQGAAKKLFEGLQRPKFKKNQGDDAWLQSEESHWWPRWEALLQAERKALQRLQEALLHANIQFSRAAFPLRLAAAGQSTFGEDWRRLNAALTDAWLPQYIRHRHPVILVDESQDLNGEQAAMLERIYLNENARWDSLLLLVGDPKQSIYRFRGGEIVHYQALRRHFQAEEIHALLLNRRASPALVAALNHHYQGAERLGDGIHYRPVQALPGARALRLHQGGEITQPLIWLESSGQQSEEAEEIAEVVAALLRGDALFAREGKRLRPQDVMVLAKTNYSLQNLAEALRRRGIEAELQEKSKLFASAVAQQFPLLLRALLQPRQASALNTLLGSLFFQWDIHRTPEPAQLERLRALLEQGEALWQRGQLLAALHLLLNEGGIWERLAQQPQGLQHVLDLRALLPILAQHGERLQPQAFLQWWQEQLQRPPEASAASLPSREALRLLTIHRAKGLQAPVVIVAGLHRKRSGGDESLQLKRYSLDGRGHVAVGELPPERRERWQEEENDEEARLLYVALTRAEDVLIVLRHKNSPPALEALWQNGLAPQAVHWSRWPAGQDDVVLPPAQQAEALPPPLSVAPRSRHYGWHRTSFTALSRGLIDHGAPESQQEIQGEGEPEALPAAAGSYRFAFPRGTRAGTFLHILLERLRPQQPQHWPREMQRYAERLQLPLDVEACSQWLREIYATPLRGSGLALQDLPQRSPELSFMLALSDKKALPRQALQDLFAAAGKPIRLQEDARHYRYLRGEIDLVYQWDGRYYIVDYKSNYLGQDWAAYGESALLQTMHSHQYWLQAAIYQLALYRRLRRLENFSPQQLGGVEYLFLRGMHPRHPSSCFWRPELEFLQRLDELLRPEEHS